MKFLFEKALNLLDAGTSLVYYLLGRELDSFDVKIINYLFSLDKSNFDINYAIKGLNSLNKGKDLLLVTNEDNLNLLQFYILKRNLAIVTALLKYGCDPNRTSINNNESNDEIFTKTRRKSSCLLFTSCNNNKCQCLQKRDRCDTIIQTHSLLTETSSSSVSTLNKKEFQIDDWADDFDDDDDAGGDKETDKEIIISQKIKYDSPLLLVCCLFNRHNLENLLPKVDDHKIYKYKKSEEINRNNNKTSNIYYDYYYGLNPLDLNETFLTTSSNTSSLSSEDEISELEIGVNYLEIDDDLYYQKYDLLDNLPRDQDVKKKVKEKTLINKKDKNFENLKELRLKLVDLLLDHGANKNYYSKISKNIYKYLNKKTIKILDNYFKSFNNDEKQITPLLFTLYFDDIELFKKLYEYQKTMFDYIKPNEYEMLIINAVRAQSHKCLVYLFKNHNNDEEILFNIISNVSSVKIIDLLFKFGVDLKIVNKHDNNCTIFFGLFKSCTNNKSILSRILNKLFNYYSKYGDIDSCLNQYNTKNELCIQYLFECRSFIKRIFFINHQNHHEFKCVFKLQSEFKEIIRILVSNDANLFLKTGQYVNAIDCLFSELKILIEKQIDHHKSTTNLFCMSYLHDLIKDILTTSNPMNFRRDSNLLAKFFELLTVNEIYINEFESTLKIIKILSMFESAKTLNSTVLRKFLTLWISNPNFLNSNQSEKLLFVKRIFRKLISHHFNLNDTTTTLNENGIQESNNLLNILIKILFDSAQVGYQAECLYDLMILLVQNGANPNIKPTWERETNHIQSNYLLAQLCYQTNSSYYLNKRNSFAIYTTTNSPTCSACSCSISRSGNQKYELLKNQHANTVSSSTLSLQPISVLSFYYLKFMDFFYEYNDTDIIHKCLEYNELRKASSASSDDLVSHLEYLCSNPRSLRSIARRCVNKMIKKPLLLAVKQLPLPSILQDYLLFNEIKSVNLF